MRTLLLTTVLFTLAVARAEDSSLDASIVCESSDVSIVQGEACYNECKPTRGFLGIGQQRVGLDRSSCLPCLQQHGDKFKLRAEYSRSGGAPVAPNATLDASIVCQSDDVAIAKGDACYNECRPSRGPLGLGKVRIGLDRKNCLPCLQTYPDKYHLRSEFSGSQEGVTCILSDDQLTATCLGKVYRLDSSVSDSGRDIIEKVQKSRSSAGTDRSGKVSDQ